MNTIQPFTNNSKLIITCCIIAMSMYSCNSKHTEADAYGNFEAEELIVSAESNGKITALNITEGQLLNKNQSIGLIDTIMIALQKQELAAMELKVYANIKSIDAQTEILKQQKANLNIDLERIKNMIKTGAATQKQLDDIQGGLSVISKQMDANTSQKNAVSQEIATIKAKKAMIDEQLNKCQILSPISGTVLTKYAEQGEITGAGKPICKMADLSTIILRAYVPGAQLYQVKSGQKCKVLIDQGKKEFMEFEGKLSWISSKAEFTPKIIQTKEERVNLVYAVKIEVKNDGTIKIGMPGEVIFN